MSDIDHDGIESGQDVDTSPAQGEDEPLVTQEFRDLLDNAISEPDQVDEKNEDVRAIRVFYNTLDRKSKAGARSFIDQKAQEEVMSGNLPFAQALFVIRKLIVEPLPAERKEPATSRARRNRTEAVTSAIASIQIGYSLAMKDAQRDDTLDTDWQDQIARLATLEAQGRAELYAEWLRNKQSGAEPEASDVEKAAARISLGRSPKGQGRKPRDGAEIDSAKEAEKAPAKEADFEPAKEADFEASDGAGIGESVIETGEVDAVTASAYAEL